ncbi:MAG: hypothetical protein LBS67_00935, partial [Clostridiales Family XIII bacterium]|nr:hypothetical protein [Clostridiales Family XIII bacterium]
GPDRAADGQSHAGGVIVGEAGDVIAKVAGSVTFAASNGSPKAAAAMNIQRDLIALLVHDPAFLADLRGRERQFTSPGLARLFLAVVAAIEESPDGAPDPPAIEEALDSEDAAALRDITRRVVIEDDPARQFGELLAQLDEVELEDRRARVVRARVELLEADAYDREAVDQLTREIDEIEKELSETSERIRG